MALVRVPQPNSDPRGESPAGRDASTWALGGDGRRTREGLCLASVKADKVESKDLVWERFVDFSKKTETDFLRIP